MWLLWWRADGAGELAGVGNRVSGNGQPAAGRERAGHIDFCGRRVICNFVLLDSTLLSITRVPLTMAEDGYLHPALAKVSAAVRNAGAIDRAVDGFLRGAGVLYRAAANRRVRVDAHGDLD